MAQVCGSSSYDYNWDRVHQAALRIVRKAADLWAADGADALELDSVVAILLRIYLSASPTSRSFETRDFDAWLGCVRPARDEIIDLRPNISSETHNRAISDLKSELSIAAQEWQMGNPQLPTSEQAINVVEHVLHANRLTRRPPHFKSPTSLLKS